MNLSIASFHECSKSIAMFDFAFGIQTHRAPVPEPIEEPLPGEHPVPQKDPVPSPNPEVADPQS